MKKIFSISLILFVIVFLFNIVNVKASSAEVSSAKVYLGNSELEMIDGVYQVRAQDYSSNRLSLTIEFSNVETNGMYRFQVDNVDNSIEESMNSVYNTTMQGWNVELNTESQDTNLEIKLYKQNGSDWEVISSKPIKLHTEFGAFKDSVISVVDVIQNGESVSPTIENGVSTYRVNSNKDTILKLDGNNFVDELVYSIRMNSMEYQFTGKELNDGLEITNVVKDGSFPYYRYELPTYLTCTLYGYNTRKNIVDASSNSIAFTNYTDTSDTTFDYEFKYFNYMDKNIEIGSFGYYYSIISKYHNVSNPLAVKISGSNYESNKTYDVNINVVNDKKQVVFTKIIQVLGSEINSGKLLKLDGYLMTGRKSMTDISSVDVNVTVDYATSKKVADYESGVNLLSTMFYATGKKSVTESNNMIGPNLFGSSYWTNRLTFDNTKSLYLHFLGEDFNNSLVYDYELYKFDLIDPAYGNYTDPVLIDSGKVSGLQLNTVGTMVEIENESNFNNPQYYYVVKYNDYIIFTNHTGIELYDSATLTTARLTYGNKNMYLQMNNYEYVATRNNNIMIKLSGIGFKDDSTYEIEIKDSYEVDNVYGNVNRSYISFTGEELNSGEAIIELDAKLDLNNVTRRNIIAQVFKENGEYFEGYEIMAHFEIKYVNCIDLFEARIPYLIDNTLDMISNISKNTSVEDFSDSAKVKGNGKVKVYDKDGKEVKNKVGTGMSARVVDEYDRDVVDVDVAVKGDISGDGDITITDLVKTEQHVSGKKELEGVYKVAADVDGIEDIGITDLVKIGQDVAGVEEVK